MIKKTSISIMLSVSLSFLLLTLLNSCVEKKVKELSQEEKDSISLVFNYDTLQNRAKAFIPEIGKYGGTLTLPAYAEPASFNPITTPGAVPYMYEGLVRINGVTGKPEPCLAEGWEVSDDNVSWKFHIRRGVQWSDSTPFSAYDVEFTFNDIIYNEKINPNIPRDMFSINGKKITVTALDSLTVQFIIPEAFAPFLVYMTQEILPKHAYEKYLKYDSFSESLGLTTPPDSMVGTGPYLLASYTPYNSRVYKRNPLYWRKDRDGNRLPYIDSIHYMFVSDLDDALQFFRSAEIDYLAADGNDFKELNPSDTNYSVHNLGPAFGSNFIVFNQNSGKDSISGKLYVNPVKQQWFQNENFRKAIAHAVNKKRIIDLCMQGRGYAQWSPLSPAVGYFHNPKVQEYPYNLKKADTLLIQAGFKDINGDGFLEDSDSNRVEFTLTINNSNTMRKNIAEIIVIDLERLGIKVNLQLIDSKIIYNKLYLPPYDWEMAMLSLSGGTEPHLGREIWHSSGKHHLWYPSQKRPSTSWEARINELFDAATVILDSTGRKALYDEWQEIAADELPLIFTVRSERILCISKRVGNVNPSVHGGLLHNVEELFIIDYTASQ